MKRTLFYTNFSNYLMLYFIGATVITSLEIGVE